MTIKESLLNLKDPGNAAFQAKLTPGIPAESFLGTRVPEIRKLEKQIRNTTESEEFLNTLPHEYYDENLLHSVMISNMKDYDVVIDAIEKFLPYVNNWAVCDALRPVIFKRKKHGLMDKI